MVTQRRTPTAQPAMPGQPRRRVLRSQTPIPISDSSPETSALNSRSSSSSKSNINTAKRRRILLDELNLPDLPYLDDHHVTSPEFEEPPLAKIMVITGQSIDEPPSNKIKKEVMGSRKLRKQLQQQAKKKSATPNDSEEVEDEDDDIKIVEKKYRSRLNTTASEKITKYSSERPQQMKPANKFEVTIPITPRKRRFQSKGQYEQKKLKQSPVKRSKSYGQNSRGVGANAPRSTATASVANTTSKTDEQQPSNLIDNEDFCSSCGLPGLFLCCESCPKSFHFQCLNPPIDSHDLPDEWHCNECLGKFHTEKQHNVKKELLGPKIAHVGILAKLFDDIQFKNPLSFKLPNSIVESFEGISMDKNGDYEDNSLKPLKTYKQLIVEQDDPLNDVYDKEGNPLFCYKCGGSGLNKRELMRCDYCSLNWHLDCLDPPMTSVKKLGSKWMCPNHVETVIQPKRRLRSQAKVEIGITRGSIIPDDANIEIINVNDGLSDNEDQINIDEEKQATILDPLFDYLSSNKNQLAYTDSSDKHDEDFTTYQVKEESIILNFLESSKIKKLNELKQISQANQHVYNNLNSSLKDYVVGLSNLSQRQIVTEEQKKINFKKLLNVIDDNYKLEFGKLEHDEIEELLYIKKLMEFKGYDKLMEFLKS